MKYTNHYNLPKTIMQAIVNDNYTRGDAQFSITDLIKPPQLLALERKHDSEIESDISDQLWMLLGQAVHHILERGESVSADNIAEERLFLSVNGTKVSGRVDLYDGKKQQVIDYKVTSTWSFLFGDKPEWTAQLNLYRLLYEHAGFPVKTLEIHAILRDWSKGKARQGGDYPKIPFITKNIPIWPKQTTFDYMKERIQLHTIAKTTLDHLLPSCSPQEQWARQTVYALMKEGRKSAIKLYNSYEEAAMDKEDATQTDKKNQKFYIQTRPSEKVRCKDYCNAKPFCIQYQKESANGNNR